MYSKTEQTGLDLSVLVESAIERVNKRHYLGAANHETNPTGGLNGYYRNIATKAYRNFANNKGQLNQLFYVYVMDACVTHTGAGNCGELSGALYLELLLSNLSVEQKNEVKCRSYLTNDAHGENSYVLVGSTVYDIWASQIYKKSAIKAKTGFAEKFHKELSGVKPGSSQESISSLRELIFTKFSKLFDDEIAKDRKNGAMYVTLNSKDPSDCALWASDAFPYLFNKFKETVEDPYFLVNQDAAKIIQGKILKDFLYLIEELRQDVPVMNLWHKNKIKYTHEAVARALKKLVPNQLFVDFILAMSYQNANPQLALDLLVKVQSTLNQNSADKLELSLISIVSAMIVTLNLRMSGAIQSAATVPTGHVDNKDSKNIDVARSKERTEKANPNNFFAESSKTDTRKQQDNIDDRTLSYH